MTANDIAERRLPVASVPVSVVLPVLNEEANIAAAVASVAWASEIFVVDSYSSDKTKDEACSAVGHVTIIDFDYARGGPRKKAWALATLEFANEWVLFVDADERVTPALAKEIANAVQDRSVSGFYVDREFRFMGRSLRCFRPNWNLRLFRASLGAMEDLGLKDLEDTGDNEIHEHFEVEGQRAFLRHALMHDDYKGIGAWIDRHNRYATWEASLYAKLRSEPIGAGPVSFWTSDAFQRKRVLRRVWTRLPGRPALRFFVWYVGRRGFLDGRQGLIFCVLMAWYEFLISLKIRELEGEA